MTLTTYLLIWIPLITAAVICVCNLKECEKRGWLILLTAVFCGGSVIFGILGGLGNMGLTTTEFSKSTVTKTPSEIIVQSKYPTQVINDMKFIDKPLKVVKTVDHNVWGAEMITKYTVEVDN